MSKISQLKKYPRVKILDGQKLSLVFKEQIRRKFDKLKTKPALAVILVGQNPASVCYVDLKKKFAQEVGVRFFLYYYPDKIDQGAIIKKINNLNKDAKITGILVQLPLPKKFNADKIIAAIAPAKDVDGFGTGTKVVPGLNLGILKLIKEAGQKLPNKKAAILARSKNFSNSLNQLLTKEKIKSSRVLSTDKKFIQKIKQADILITALGKPNFIKASMIKKDAIIIDVGTSYKDGRVYGDVSDSAGKFALAISPVPGGVGPLTVAMLFANLIKLRKLQNRSFK